MSIKHLKALEEYNQLISSSPCILKFTAKWCPPCKRLTPIYEKLASELSSKVPFFEIDIDEATEITNYENIQSIPLVLFYKGQMVKDLSVRGFDPTGLEKNIRTFVADVEKEEKKEDIPKLVLAVDAGPPDTALSHLVLDDIVEDDSEEDFEEESEETTNDSEALIEKTIPEDLIHAE